MKKFYPQMAGCPASSVRRAELMNDIAAIIRSRIDFQKAEIRAFRSAPPPDPVKTIFLQLETIPLPWRQCPQCASPDFRAVVVASAVSKDDPGAYAQTSVPMSVCINCGCVVIGR